MANLKMDKDTEREYSFFISGNTFNGEFHQDYPIEGTFIYNQSDVSFTGTVNEDCTPNRNV